MGCGVVSAVKLTTSVHKMLQPFTRLQHLVANLLWIDGHAALRSYPERLEAVHLFTALMNSRSRSFPTQGGCRGTAR